MAQRPVGHQPSQRSADGNRPAHEVLFGAVRSNHDQPVRLALSAQQEDRLVDAEHAAGVYHEPRQEERRVAVNRRRGARKPRRDRLIRAGTCGVHAPKPRDFRAGRDRNQVHAEPCDERADDPCGRCAHQIQPLSLARRTACARSVTPSRLYATLVCERTVLSDRPRSAAISL